MIINLSEVFACFFIDTIGGQYFAYKFKGVLKYSAIIICRCYPKYICLYNIEVH